MQQEIMDKAWEAVEKSGLGARADFDAWAAAPDNGYESFLGHVRNLPQRDMVPEERALAWLWSFQKNPSVISADEPTRDKYFMGARTGMSSLSPYDCAIVSQEMDTGETGFTVRSAETIRRDLLLKNLYGGIIDTPASRLKNLALDAMRKDFLQAVIRDNIGNPGFRSARPGSINFSCAFPLSAYGSRYAAVNAAYAGKEPRTYLCILTVDDDDSKETDFRWELAALDAAVGGAWGYGACFIHPGAFKITTKFFDAAEIRERSKPAADMARVFFERHVMGDEPFKPRREQGKCEISPESLDRLSDLWTEAAKLHLLKKKIDEKDKLLRAEMSATLSSEARLQGVRHDEIDVPSGLMTVARGWKINDSELDYLLSAMPEMGPEIGRSIRDNPEKMAQILEEMGVDERRWREVVPDTKLIIKFCEERGISVPMRPTVSFRINSAAKKGKERLAELEREMTSQMATMGIIE